MNEGVILYLLNMNRVRRLKGTEDKAIDYVFGLLDIPWWYYAIAVLLGVAVWRVWKKPTLGLLVGYAVLLLAKTVLIREPFQGEHVNLELLWSWRQWSVQQNQILANVIMFLPVGVLAGRIWRWRGLWFAAGLSVGIEILQLVTSRGLCEFDDVFHNVIGAALGIVVLMVLRKMLSTREGNMV